MRVVRATEAASPGQARSESTGHESEDPRSAIRRPLELENGGPDAWDQRLAGMSRPGTSPHQGRIRRPDPSNGRMQVDWQMVFGSGTPPLCCNSPARPSPGLERISGRTGGGVVSWVLASRAHPPIARPACVGGEPASFIFSSFLKKVSVRGSLNGDWSLLCDMTRFFAGIRPKKHQDQGELRKSLR